MTLSPMVKVISLALRAWPFANGTGRIIARWGADLDLGVGKRTCQTSDGFAIDVLAEDYIGRHLILAGKHDRSLIEVLLAFSETGDVCLDIGANIGYVAGVLLTRIPNGVVHCVEPQPLVAELLAANLARFPADRWRLVEAALSDEDRDGLLHIDTVNRGASSLNHAANAGQSVSVRLLSADAFMQGFDRLDLVKMDIEGHEESVFRAAEDQLKRLRPRAILYEDHDQKSGADGHIGALLGRIGYEVYAIKKRLKGNELVSANIADLAQFDDYIAVSRSHDLPAKALRLLGR